MTLSELSIRRPVFAWMLFGATLLFGYIGFSRMGVSQLPDVDFPMVNISIRWEGASPEAMEANVAEPIEEAAQLADRRAPLLEVHEMHFHATLLEETLRFARVRVVGDAEDLDFHASR